MEMDTDAAVSIASEETRTKLFPEEIWYWSWNLHMRKAGAMTILGEITVQVKYSEQVHLLPLTVVVGKAFWGSNWMYQIQLDWKS